MLKTSPIKRTAFSYKRYQTNTERGYCKDLRDLRKISTILSVRQLVHQIRSSPRRKPLLQVEEASSSGDGIAIIKCL